MLSYELFNMCASRAGDLVGGNTESEDKWDMRSCLAIRIAISRSLEHFDGKIRHYLCKTYWLYGNVDMHYRCIRNTIGLTEVWLEQSSLPWGIPYSQRLSEHNALITISICTICVYLTPWILVWYGWKVFLYPEIYCIPNNNEHTALLTSILSS